MPKSTVVHQTRSDWTGPQEIHYRVTTFTRQRTSRPHVWRPPTDLYETEHSYVARVEIAGMKDAELNIAIEGTQLAIYGLRQPPEDNHSAYHQLEVRYGDFLSVLELPGSINSDHIRAEYDDGFLLVTMPKAGAR